MNHHGAASAVERSAGGWCPSMLPIQCCAAGRRSVIAVAHLQAVASRASTKQAVASPQQSRICRESPATRRCSLPLPGVIGELSVTRTSDCAGARSANATRGGGKGRCGWPCSAAADRSSLPSSALPVAHPPFAVLDLMESP